MDVGIGQKETFERIKSAYPIYAANEGTIDIGELLTEVCRLFLAAK
jgi:hypothetical protein